MPQTRRSLQIGRSTFRTEPHKDAWWVVEDYDLMGHHRTRDEREEWFGPFTEDEATRKAAAWRRAALDAG